MSPAARFYKTVGVAEEDGGWSVRLDGRPVRTPQRAVVALPTRALAEAVAEEWRGQGAALDSATMPLTRLAYAAIDVVRSHRARVVADILGYGRSDLVCYRAQRPAGLVAREAAAWDPLLAWLEERFGARLLVGAGIAHVQQPAAALARLEAALAARDEFVLAALHAATALTGSLVLALALAKGRLGPEETFACSRVDESFQADAWGRDAEAEARAERHAAELAAIARFLALARP